MSLLYWHAIWHHPQASVSTSCFNISTNPPGDPFPSGKVLPGHYRKENHHVSKRRLAILPNTYSPGQRAWAKFKNKHPTRVLEPSAGDGALIKAHPNWGDSYYYRPKVDAIEIDIAKHEVPASMWLVLIS